MRASRRIVKMYQRPDGTIPFTRWYKNLRDARGQQKILARINRMKLGNLGDHRSVGEGVTELRIAFGPGYRVYFGQEGEEMVVLLVGGDKGTQDDDIKTAKTYWESYKKEKKHAHR